jgi:hypothetical protein
MLISNAATPVPDEIMQLCALQIGVECNETPICRRHNYAVVDMYFICGLICDEQIAVM